MRIANVEHQGRCKVVFSNGNGDWREALEPQRKPSRSIQDLLDSGRLNEVCLLAEDAPACAGELRFRAPFARPRQSIALARNYTAHAQESTLPIPHEPIFFSKSNTSVVGPEEAVVLPPNLGRVEPEIELAIVIGR